MGGMLSVLPNTSNISQIPDPNNWKIEIPPSNITYAQGYERIVFENGALIRKYEDGVSIMESNPLINIYNTGDGNITLSIHAIILNGTLSSTSGEGNAWIETRYISYNQTIPPSPVPNTNAVFLSIPTNYPEAWEDFFDKKLQDAGLRPNIEYIRGRDNIHVNIQINGTQNGPNPDIFLSLYESRLDVKIR
jgi:hypothetical protein